MTTLLLRPLARAVRVFALCFGAGPGRLDFFRFREMVIARVELTGLEVLRRLDVEGEFDLVAGGRGFVLGADAQRVGVDLCRLLARSANAVSGLPACRGRPEIVDVPGRSHVDRDRIARTPAVAIDSTVKAEVSPAIADRNAARKLQVALEPIPLASIGVGTHLRGPTLRRAGHDKLLDRTPRLTITLAVGQPREHQDHSH